MFRTLKKWITEPFHRVFLYLIFIFIVSFIEAYKRGELDQLFYLILLIAICYTFYYFFRSKKSSKKRYLSEYPSGAQLYLSQEISPDYIKAIDKKTPVQGEDDDGLFFFIPYSFSEDDPNKKPVLLTLSTIPMQSEHAVFQTPTEDIAFEFIGINSSFILKFDKKILKYQIVKFDK